MHFIKSFVSLLALSTGALAAAIPDDNHASRSVLERRDANADTDRLLFHTSMGDFLKARNAKSPGNLDWSSDGCSKSPDHPDGFNFLDSCYRHDFGYRNYKKQHRFNEDVRGKIDQNLKNDLYNECKKYHGLESWKGVVCRRDADIYYIAVRAAGGS